MSYDAKYVEIIGAVVKKLDILVREVWGSIIMPIKSNTESVRLATAAMFLRFNGVQALGSADGSRPHHFPKINNHRKRNRHRSHKAATSPALWS